MADLFDDAADGFETCCKQDVPAVEAVIQIVLPDLEAYWRQLASEMEEAIRRELAGLSDDRGADQVDALAILPVQDRDEALQDLLVAILGSLRRASSPPPAEITRLVRRASERLLRRGAASISEPLDLTLAPRLVPGAAADLATLIQGRVETRRQEIERHVRDYLTRSAPRSRAVATLELDALGRAQGFNAWLAGLRQLLGRDNRWLPFTVDQWAYRWYSVGTFIAGRQNGVLVFQAVAVLDTQTTPFCRWVNGRFIETGRAERQVERHVQLALDGDVDGLIRNWPLLDPKIVRGSDTRAFARAFRGVTLPPYHGGCRTIVRPATIR